MIFFTVTTLFGAEQGFVLFEIVVRYVILRFVGVQDGALLAKILLHGSFTAFLDSQLMQVRTTVVW